MAEEKIHKSDCAVHNMPASPNGVCDCGVDDDDDGDLEGATLTKKNQFNFCFGIALESLKKGDRVARRGWNGKGMYLYLQQGHKLNDSGGIIGIDNPITKEEKVIATFLPHIMMKTADEGNVFVPWLASQTDLLAEDWVEVIKV